MFTLSLRVVPFCSKDRCIQTDETSRIVLLPEPFHVRMDLLGSDVVATPAWIRVEGEGIRMGRNITCTAWIAVFEPSSP
jgi:hypothetical protein